jgi:glutamate racemase
VTQLLINQGINTIIVACHTSSATSLEYLKKEFPQVTFIDMILPTILAAEHITQNNTVGIIATPATIKSDIHKTLFKEHFPYITVLPAQTPQLVPFIESQKTETSECFNYIQKIINELLKKNIDTLILGCTHYPFIENIIKKIAPELKIVSAAHCIKHGHNKIEKDITFYVSGDKKEFGKKVDTFLNIKKYLLKKFI